MQNNNLRRAYFLGILIFFISILTVLFSYFISIKYNLVSICFPNFEGCTSISRAGRYPPAVYIFKPGMMLVAFMILFFFYFLKDTKKAFSFSFCFSIIAFIFFFLYIYFLGESSIYRFFRKVGIFIYIANLLIAFLFLGYEYKNKIKNIFIKLCTISNSLLILVAILLLPFMYKTSGEFSALKNAISWNFFLIVKINFFLFALSIRKNNKILKRP